MAAATARSRPWAGRGFNAPGANLAHTLARVIGNEAKVGARPYKSRGASGLLTEPALIRCRIASDLVGSCRHDGIL